MAIGHPPAQVLYSTMRVVGLRLPRGDGLSLLFPPDVVQLRAVFSYMLWQLCVRRGNIKDCARTVDLV